MDYTKLNDLLINLSPDTLINQKKSFETEKFRKTLLKYARKNGLYYYLISSLKSLGINFKDKNWETELKKQKELINSIKLLNTISIDKKLNFILIKSYNSIPNVPRDIDIFVNPKDRTNMIKSLEEKGFLCIHSGVSETSIGLELLKVDIYTDLCYFGKEFMDAEYLNQSIVIQQTFNTTYPGLNYDAELILTLVHGFFGHRRLTLLDLLHINNMLKNANITACQNYANSKGWGYTFKKILNEIDLLNEKINRNEKIIFPHIFKKDVIFDCLSNTITLNRKRKIFIHISLFQDRIMHEMQDTTIYDLIKSIKPLRNFINSLTSVIKVLRGDKKSFDE